VWKCFAVYGYFWHDTSLLNAAGVTLGMLCRLWHALLFMAFFAV
jgi:hypothetical protein